MNISPENIRRMQLLELDILLEVKRICTKHDIKFFLIGGTAIGAIRHKGFIPWDDDIDISMMRSDFERFCALAPSELDAKYFLQTPDTDSEFANYCCGRVRLEGTKIVSQFEPAGWKHSGFFVDILPQDAIPANYRRGFFYWTWFNILCRALWLRLGYKPHPRNRLARIVMYLCRVLLAPMPTKQLRKTLHDYHTKYANKNTGFVAELAGAGGYRKSRLPVSDFADFTEMEFEGHKMPLLRNYDAILQHQFGDYMKLPPPEDRVARHIVEVNFG